MSKKQEVQTEQTTQAARNPYQQVADEVRQAGIEGSLLRFSKHGQWIAGADQEVIPAGLEVIMGFNTYKRGWQKWKDQKPVDARMGLVHEGFRIASREELGDLDEDEWEEYDGERRDPWQNTMQILFLDPKKGDVYTFVTSSKSGQAALGEVSGIYGNRLQDGEDPDMMPVAKLMSDSYQHKVYGEIMIPVFELTGKWVKPPEKKPAKASAKKSAVKAAPKPNAPKALPPPRGATKSNGNRKGASI